MVLERIFFWLKRVAIIGISTLVGLYLLAWIFEDRLGQVVLRLVKDELTTELTVVEFHLSFIRAFPKIQGTFTNVLLEDTNGDTLLACEKLAVHMKWSSLWSDVPSLDALLLESGMINLITSKKGKPNYLVFKEKAEEDPDKPFALDIRKALLEDIHIHYADLAKNQHVDLNTEEAEIKGRFVENDWQIEHKIKGALSTGAKSDSESASLWQVETEGILDIDVKANRYTLNDTYIKVNGLDCHIKGLIEPSEKQTYLDLTAQTGEVPIEELWQLMHSYFPESANKLNPSGTASIEFTAKGMLRGTNLPAMKASLMWQKGTLKLPSGPDIEDIVLDLKWEQPLGKPYGFGRLNVHSCEGMVSGQPFTLSGEISQLNDPVLDIRANGSLPVALIQTATLTGEQGMLTFSQLAIKGKLNRSDLKATGTIGLDQVRLRYLGDPVQVDQGTLTIADDRLQVADLLVGLAGTQLRLEGQVMGLPEQFRALQSPVPVQFNGTISSDKVDVHALMEQFAKWQPANPKTKTQGAPSEATGPAFTVFKGTLAAKVGAFTYQDVKGSDFSGSVVLDGRKMLISGDAGAMEGTFNLEGELTWGKHTVWEGALTCEEVNVHEAFRQCRNFGQSFITKDHLKGTLSTQLVFTAEWDANGVFQPNLLDLSSAIQIDEGELVNLSVLETFSDYIHVRDLRHVRFNTLQNYLEVDKGKIYLPRMLIQSNALALDITGLHGFDQSIDYGIRVDAGQVMMSKITKHDPRMTPKPNKKNGWFNLYYHLYGNVDKFAIKADRDRVKDDFQRSIFHRNRIRASLIEAFGELLFDEEQQETEAVAGTPEKTNLLPDMSIFKKPTTQRPETKKPSTRAEESEYLEDFEIEGGGAKKKK
jgi:hypothetical protein